MRVLLADEHQMFREGLAAWLEARDVEVVGHASDGRMALRLSRDLTPDVVVLDAALRGLNGIETTRLLLADRPSVHVVALCARSDRRLVHALLSVGARGYVLKSSPAAELLRALRAVVKRRRFLDEEITDVVLQDYLGGHAGTLGESGEELAPREREVLQLLAEGKSSSEIATLLDVATPTIATHRRNIMRKLDLHTVAELTKYAVREGLTSL